MSSGQYLRYHLVYFRSLTLWFLEARSEGLHVELELLSLWRRSAEVHCVPSGWQTEARVAFERLLNCIWRECSFLTTENVRDMIC